jgi:hypothetical protein
MSETIGNKCEKWILLGVFLLALGYNLWGVTYHFRMGFMAGHEFRQSQTALTSYYIDQDNNFSLLYETPLLGKPWVALLLEVPFYEWSVVGLSRLSGWEHVVAARVISATCFYGLLAGVWLLLGSLGVARMRRLLFLSLVLATPVYIFYSRAFLMDSMALMAAVWWLYAFVRVMRDRDWRWLVLAVVAGTLSALIKGAVYAVWLVPGAAYGAWVLWGEWRAKLGWKRLAGTIAWGLGTVVVALGLLEMWLAYTDPIKAAHASAWIFTSKNVSLGNWGLLSPTALLSGDVWRALLHCWEQAIMDRWLLGAVLVGGLFLKRVRWAVLGIGGMFFAAQFMMPYAFAYQDYYYYICAVFAVVACGFVVSGLLDTKAWWGGWALVAVLVGAQVHAYFGDYFQQQKIVHHGGYPMTDVIRDMTPKNSVIVVAGADWAAMTPLYAQRRALMIRNGLEYDRDYLNRAFADLDGELVSAVVLWGNLRTNREFIAMAAEHFHLNPATPTFSWDDHCDVYITKFYEKGVQSRLQGSRQYGGIRMADVSYDFLKSADRITLTPQEAAVAFMQITPLPYQFAFDIGLDWMDLGYRKVLSVHPDSDLWIRPPESATEIKWTFGIFDTAYERAGDRTDGVVFLVLGETAGGESRIIYQRLLDPVNNPGDRGDQQIAIPYQPLPGESLRFSTRDNLSKAFDWAYTVEIKVE